MESDTIEELLKKMKAASLPPTAVQDMELVLTLRKNIMSLGLDPMPLSTLVEGITDIIKRLMTLSNALSSMIGIVMGQAEDKKKAKATVKLVLDTVDVLMKDLLTKTAEQLNDSKQLELITLPSNVVFEVEKLVESGMSHSEAAEAAVNKYVSDPGKHFDALMGYYKSKYMSKITERANELGSKQSLPQDAALLQAIDEIIDNSAVRIRLKEKVYLIGLAQQSGIPPGLIQGILGMKR